MDVSVVITCYNEESYIEQCFNSVVDQSVYQDIKEIFIIDDGSTDSSPQILNNLKLKFNKLKVITTEGLGQSAARNIAIKLCKSEFIAFLDADDYWTKYKLKNQLEVFKNNSSIGLVYGDFWDFKNSDASDATCISVRSLNRYHTNQLIEYFITDAPIIPSTTICRKKVFDTVGLFNEQLKTNEDNEMYLRIAEKWRHFHVNNADCYKRRKEGQITHRLEKLLNDQNKVGAIAISRNPYLKKFAKRRESFRNVKIAIDCFIRHKEKKKAFVYAVKALKLNPFSFRAWALIVMALMPYEITLKMYNSIKNIFHQLKKK